MTAPDDLRYPIGKAKLPGAAATPEQRSEWIREIDSLPDHLDAAVQGLTPEQWETPYRPGGWTVRQVVHHLPDSHLNAYTRFKLALTEDEPAIRPYKEAAWAELADTRDTPPDVSLTLLTALHTRWVTLLRSMGNAEFARTVYHPEQNRTFTLDQMLALYAWHGRHHVAHITGLRQRVG